LPADLPNSIYTLKVKGSRALTFNQSTDLSYNSKEAFSVFIQINKAIFKPDDTVNFRVFGIYPDLKSYSGSMDVSIYDANSNKIKQWNKVNPVNGVFTQKLVLSAQPVLGDWKIEAKANTTRAQKIFTVAKYVLPKFKVEIVMPSFALTSDNDITVTIKSRYTYDKPVKGTADVLVKLNQFENSMPIDFAQSLPVTSLQMSINGEAKVTVPKDLINAKDKDVLIVIANVTESLTGNKMTAKNTVTFYDQVAQLEYPEINPKSFKPGLKYSAYLQITQPDGLPTTSITEPVRISWKVEKEKKPLDSIRLRLPKNGIVSFSVNVPLNASSLIISATFQGVTKELTVEPSYSPSSSYMQLALKTASVIRAGDVVFFEVTSTTPMTQLVYQVLSKGVIVKVGSENATSKFSHQFSVVSDSSMAPSARMVIYFYRRDGEIVIDSISFDVSGAFKNKVSFGFNSKSVDPGNNVTVTVRADPNSAAYLLAIDQSVLLIRGDNDVTSDDVFTDLKKYDTAADSAECSTCKSGLWPSWTLGGAVALEIFTKAGVVALTDAVIIQSKPSDENEDSWLMRNPGAIMVPMVPKQIRQVFTETFLWSDLTIGVNGSASITATVPDTITSWVASAFAVNSESGLGIAPSQSYLQVFRPFFVSLNLPYSVIRGEHLVVQANVFNYMTEDMQVTVTLAASDKFYNIEIDANGANGLFQQSQSVKVIMNSQLQVISFQANRLTTCSTTPPFNYQPSTTPPPLNYQPSTTPPPLNYQPSTTSLNYQSSTTPPPLNYQPSTTSPLNYQPSTPPPPLNYQPSTTPPPLNYQPSTTTSPLNYQPSTTPPPLNYQPSTTPHTPNYQPSATPPPLNYQPSTTTSPLNYQPSTTPHPPNYQPSTTTSPLNYQSSTTTSPLNYQPSTTPPPLNYQPSTTPPPLNYQPSTTSPLYYQPSTPPPPLNYQPSTTPPPLNYQPSTTTSPLNYQP
ncbi:BgTEP3.p1, partial [Biomphalaria glabrata]